MAILTTVRNFPVFRWIATAVLLIPVTAGIIWDEVLLAGPIIFLVELLGFWLGYVVFCTLWAALGLFVLSVWLRIEPGIKKHIFSKIFGKKEKPIEVGKETEKEPSNWRKRLVLWIAGFAKALGALAAAVILGPVFGWPVFKILGYRERDVYLFTIGAAWVFGGIWVPFYGLGVWGFGLSRLF